jgi:hypothetical protein
MPSLNIAQVAVATPNNPVNTYNPTLEARFDRDRESSNSERDQIYNTSELMTRDDGLIRQTSVFKETTFFNIDAAHGLTDQSLTTYYNSFYFDDSAGEGVPVYIVDSEANLQSVGDISPFCVCNINTYVSFFKGTLTLTISHA